MIIPTGTVLYNAVLASDKVEKKPRVDGDQST
jgi:hypothetical protein